MQRHIKGKIWVMVPYGVEPDKLFHYFSSFGDIDEFKISKCNETEVVKLVYNNEEGCEKLDHAVSTTNIFGGPFCVKVLKREYKKYETDHRLNTNEKFKQKEFHLDYPLAWM
ncbi:hypothetical protein EIN_087190 [Entamoeba invadens IP1]|uniref:hypothetical protein n=1 Tax=Entamoeba invadens IP1 TaxID=370355 RepID=UPI0002C3F1C4|nr:hypothetical protein EIN_087190 [Entamoeba invadens IP1]ELP85417.1 hypothetical protein EIN_087190 [Entamoeba invadens IP1]|eukprot:XP_004184763.1 hypothetical protein EIN_087190 [Entamoeba invadens IP1]